MILFQGSQPKHRDGRELVQMHRARKAWGQPPGQPVEPLLVTLQNMLLALWTLETSVPQTVTSCQIPQSS